LSGKFTIVRLTLNGDHFEILVNPNPALNYTLGRPVELSQVLVYEEIFSEASKGLRVSAEKLKKFFNTTSTLEIAKAILKKGELQLTTEQRRSLIEDKKKQIVTMICKSFIDPKTGFPHPRVRVEQALDDARVSIDPFKNVEEQVKKIIEQLRSIIPLKSENIKLMIKVPPQFTPQVMGILKSYGETLEEEWLFDGSLSTTLEIPAGVQIELIDRINSISKGASQIRKVS
jgi:ribosome maturation protein SDO1